MNSSINKLIIGILFGFFSTLLIVNFSLAVTATLIGEVTDDGGDPYLYVWFQYGKTTAYGFETPRQEKYGIGEFRATVTNLEECTTYHYRAVVKHRDYDDTKYGEDKTFTTPCAGVFVDIKANGSDGPITIPFNSSATLTWTSSNATYCFASGAWSGLKSTSGSESTGNLTSGPRTYTITCTGPGGSASDSVTIYVQQVLGATSPSIQKRVRNVSDGQNYFSNSVIAEPGEVLEFQIIVNAGSGANNVTLKDVLPSKISIRPNTLKIDGVLTTGDIVSGISLGNLTANQTKTITFLADVAEALQFNFGDTNLVNTATIYWNGNSLSASANIIVRKVGVLGATSVQTGQIKGILWNKFFSIFIVVASLTLFLFSSHLIKWEEWLDEKRANLKKSKADLLFKLKRAKIKFLCLKKRIT